MKLQAKSSRELQLSLQAVAKCMSSKNAMAILDSALLSNRDGKFFLTTSTNSSQLTISAPLTLCEGEFVKSVALPVKMLLSFLAALPECVITFTFIESTHAMIIEYCTKEADNIKTGKVSLAYNDGEEFPIMQRPTEDKFHIVLPSEKLVSVIEQSAPFVAVDELRMQMNTLCIDISEDKSELIFVTSDGHVLYKNNYPNSPAKGGTEFFRRGDIDRILLHRMYFRLFTVFAQTDTVEIESDGYIHSFVSGDIEFLCRSVEGRYPNYNSVIPKDNPYFVCFNRGEMLAVLKRVRLFNSESTDLVEIKKDGMFINVLAQDVDFARSAEDQVVITDSKCEENFSIGFKAARLIEALSSFKEDNMRLQLTDPSRAGVIQADVASPYTIILLMPMLLND